MNLISKKMCMLYIFLITLCVLGVPYTDWGLIQDDYGFIHFSQIKSLADIVNFFKPHDIGEAFSPGAGALKGSHYFFSVMYRPMQYVLFGLETFFLGTNPYFLLLLIVSIHALMAAVLLYILCYFFSLKVAFLGSLLFAFHPLLEHWLGVFTTQIYIVDLAYLLGIVFLVKRFFDTKKIFFYLISLIMYLGSLFAKETLILFPIWILVLGCWYLRNILKIDARKAFIKSFLISLGYGIMTLTYLGVRLLLFPLPPVGFVGTAMHFDLTLNSFISRQMMRLGDFISYICDPCFVGFLPNGNRLIKGSLIMLFVVVILYPFIKQKKIHYLLLSGLSIFLFTWPAVFLYYQPRYMYVGLPFFIFIFMYAFSWYCRQNSIKIRIAAWSLVGTLLLCNVVFLCSRQKLKEQATHVILAAFTELADNPKIENRSLCFIGLPMLWFGSGNAQAMWLLTGKKQAINYDMGTFIWRAQNAHEVKQYHVDLIDEGNVFRIMCLDNMQTHFSVHCPYKIIKKNLLNYPIEIIVSKMKYADLGSDVCFITWDYQELRFKIL